MVGVDGGGPICARVVRATEAGGVTDAGREGTGATADRRVGGFTCCVARDVSGWSVGVLDVVGCTAGAVGGSEWFANRVTPPDTRTTAAATAAMAPLGTSPSGADLAVGQLPPDVDCRWAVVGQPFEVTTQIVLIHGGHTAGCVRVMRSVDRPREM